MLQKLKVLLVLLSSEDDMNWIEIPLKSVGYDSAFTADRAQAKARNGNFDIAIIESTDNPEDGDLLAGILKDNNPKMYCVLLCDKKYDFVFADEAIIYRLLGDKSAMIEKIKSALVHAGDFKGA